MAIRFLSYSFVISNDIGGVPIPVLPGTGAEVEWIEPDSSLIVGKLASFASTSKVVPSRIKGYWSHKNPSERTVRPGDKVLFYLHPGGYIMGSASPGALTAGIPNGVMKTTPSVKHFFAPDYRLSKPEGNPFPAAIMDAVAGYAHLLRMHNVAPKDVVFEGDSAGGNLVLSVVKYLVEHREQLEPLGIAPPGAIILMSPWADLGNSHRKPKSPGYFEQTDIIVTDGPDAQDLYSQKLYAGPIGIQALDTNPYISPASKELKETPSFKGWPRTFISCGGAEQLADCIRLLRDRMAADLNESWKPAQLTYIESAPGFHTYPAFSFFNPERTETLKAVAAWMESA